MKKLKLNLDEIKVESFESTILIKNSRKGTVNGHATFITGEECEVTGIYYDTCNANQTCVYCWGTGIDRGCIN